MNSLEIRKKFFDFFVKRGHTHVPSSSLIPAQDPTLLFTNAGMNQFKDLFLGRVTPPYTRAVSIQKCMRAGGKHNDLDNVGFTKRHLTFFEMMGNFSFGDYFKKEAIEFAWEFLTNVMQIDPQRMVVSVFVDDDEAFDIWHNIMKLPKEKIYRLGASENFWQMGDTGPCGPCSEIHIDRGPNVGCGKSSCDPACDCERFVEIWNLVFMQYDRQADGNDKPLEQKGIDTGMGFERLCTIMQNKDSIYETDLFVPLIQAIEKLTDVNYAQQDEEKKAAFHVLADHIRATCFAIADGAVPSNEGRGYVLRKIIRRAALFERKLTTKPIFPDLAYALINLMSPIYPELKEQETIIVSVLTSEIEKFATNLDRGYPILEELLVTHLDTKTIPGTDAFKLYDTYGFPLELVIARAREKGFTVDASGFEKEMARQRKQSTKKVAYDDDVKVKLPADVTTEFTGYWEAEPYALHVTSPVIALLYDGTQVQKVNAGSICWVVTKQSPFFVESGGQVDDQGWLEVAGNKVPLEGLKKIDGAIAMRITAPTSMKVGQEVSMHVDESVRQQIMKNHTATHLLQAALIEVLGKQVKQAGSVVTPDYMRFDFTYHQALTPEQVKQVEYRVNEVIQLNIPLNIFQTTLQEATSKGVIAIFGEKYAPEDVRVIEVQGFSAELCGGTHVERTGEIGCFKITELSALSAGTRRIVAVTGPRAVEIFQQTFGVIKQLSQEFKVKSGEVLGAVERQQEQLKQANTQLRNIKKELWKSQVDDWVKMAEMVAGIPVLVLQLKEYAPQELKEMATTLMNKNPGFYVVLSSVNGRTFFVASVANEYALKINLKNFGAWLKTTFSLSGGGSPTLIQGGGDLVSKDIKGTVVEWVEKGSS